MKITVIGAGSWGTAIAGVAAAHADEVMLWSFDEASTTGINEQHVNPLYLSDYRLPDNVSAIGSYEDALAGADGIIVVVPSPFIRSTLRNAAPEVPAGVPVLTLTKGITYPCGIEQDTGITLLTHNLGKPCLPYLKAITPQQVRIECRTLLLRHRR